MRTFGWSVMTLLSFAVAGYALAFIALPDLRPPLMKALFADRPTAAGGHFVGGALALVAGALQFSARIRTRYLEVHRWTGRAYVLAVIGGGIAALFLAPHAFGGIVSHSGFGVLGVLWIGATIHAWMRIRQGDVQAHRRWMIRSFALTLAAVTLRIYLPLSQVGGLDMAVAYPVIAWLCWVPNLLLAEWFIRARPVP